MGCARLCQAASKIVWHTILGESPQFWDGLAWRTYLTNFFYSSIVLWVKSGPKSATIRECYILSFLHTFLLFVTRTSINLFTSTYSGRLFALQYILLVFKPLAWTLWRPLLPYFYSYKAPVPDRVKPSFVIFDIRALWCSALSIGVPGCQKLEMMP